MTKKIVKVKLLHDQNDGRKKGAIEKWGLKDALLWEKNGIIKILDNVKEPKKVIKKKITKKPKKKLLSEKEIVKRLKEISKLEMPLEVNKKIRKLKEESDYSLQTLQKQLSYIRKGIGKSSDTVDTVDTVEEIKPCVSFVSINTPLAPTLFGESTLEQIIKNLVLSKSALTFGELAIKTGQSEANIRNTISRNKSFFGIKKGKGRICYTYLLHMVFDELQVRIDTIKKREQEKEQEIKEKEEKISKEEELVIEAKNFFDSFKKDIGKQLRQGNVILIDFMKITEFSNKLSDEILVKPEETLKILEEALEEGGLINFPRVRIKNIPKNQRIFIENIRSKNVNELIFVEGRVVSITDVRPQVVNAKFECPSCGTIISVLQIEKKFREPARCSCGRRGGFRLLSKEMVDTAKIILEDLQEKTDNPYTRRLNIFIKEDLTAPENIKMFTPGNEVKVVGILKEVPVQLRAGGFSTKFDIALEVNSVELSEEEVNILKFSDEDIREIKDVSAIIDNEGLKEINTSFAPDVYGYEEIKNAIILQLCNQRNFPKSEGARNKPNILLIGDPGVAKSVLGNFAVSITHGARRVVGGGSSAVGITASVIKEEDGWRVEPGAFVLARDLLFIDELNNLHDEDKPKLQEAMSEQSVTISKANIRMKMKVTAGALATANPMRGVFKDDEDLVKQFNLPLPIINRFDEIFIMRDNISKDSDEAIASKMVSRDRGTIKAKYSKDFLKKFFTYIKNFKEPHIDNKIATRLKKLYSQLRRYKTSSININPRVNESLLRLIKSSAKIRLSDKVEEKDIERAINILSNSYYNLPDYSVFKDIKKNDMDVLIDKSKKYKDYGAVDFEDHELEERNEQNDKEMEEIESSTGNKGVYK